MSEPTPATLIYNPRAGRRRVRLVERLRRALAEAGFEATPQATSGPGDATGLAAAAARAGQRAVFAFGGDGTLREAAAGLLGSRVPLGVLPGGTANVMRLELGLPADPLAAAGAMATAAVREFDVGLCGDEPFLMQASAGADAVALRRMTPAAKRRWGTAAAAWPALLTWVGYGFPAIELEADGEALAASFVVVGNIARFGGPWTMLPEARCDDGRLDLLALRGGRWASLGLTRDFLLQGGRHLRRPDVTVRCVERVTLAGPADLAVQVDGDPLPRHPPLTIRLAGQRVRLLAAAAGTVAAAGDPL